MVKNATCYYWWDEESKYRLTYRQDDILIVNELMILKNSTGSISRQTESEFLKQVSYAFARTNTGEFRRVNQTDNQS
ncbi:hypothetical protein GWI33_005905 [Rhynchophorus ferrugineus]|uniref:Uncharacterized protein n=1 Tax=Rhynchophorus ferrugineus TaxID=354439 RepID=A0A834IW93_RHYFE|nr:hypothetical protein GWI33_005905 [Rhynchophorus ferrugineus]